MAVGAVWEGISDGEDSLGPNIIAVVQVKDLEVLGLDKNRNSGEKRIGGGPGARPGRWRGWSEWMYLRSKERAGAK